MTADSLKTTIVIPTLVRPTLWRLLASLREQFPESGPDVVVVDDRAQGDELDRIRMIREYGLGLRVLRSGGRGPAAARNVGWRAAATPWITFLDDDVVVGDAWAELLHDDLARAERGGQVGSQARITVPLPQHRAATDAERGVAELERARWITADMSYRRDALTKVGGFDERFPSAYREDADLALRLGALDGSISKGRRITAHPFAPAPFLVSAHRQRGNADDALMRRLHGRDWRHLTGNPRSRLPEFASIQASSVAALAAVASKRWLAALPPLTLSLALTSRFAWQRIAPGPRDRREIAAMTATSFLIPPLALWHRTRGWLQHRKARPWPRTPDLALLDRDGTLIENVPYNGDPSRVRPLPGVAVALDRLRREGVRLAIITNQAAIGHGMLSRADVAAVNDRVVELLGPLDAVYVCPHTPDAGCRCREPAPGLIENACSDFDAPPSRCVVIGDIAADVRAAVAAGARAILVPNQDTSSMDIDATAHVAESFEAAADMVVRGEW